MGPLGAALELRGATLSFHLNQLRQAGLITCRRKGRSLLYAAQFGAMNRLLAYLAENCCQGEAPSCAAVPYCAQAEAVLPMPCRTAS